MAKADTSPTYEEAFAILAGLASLASPTAADSEAGRLDISHHDSRLHVAEARYRALVEQIPAVTFIASLVGGISEVYVSPQIESLLGFTQEEWVSDPVLWFRQLHPEDRPLLTAEFAAACSTGRPLRGMCRAYTRDGRLVWVHGEARFVRDEQGRPLFLQGIAFDVTEQQRALETRQLLMEEQAQRAEADRQRAQLQGIFATIPAAITILRGPEHVVEYMNSAAREMNAGAVDAIGRPFGEAFPEYAGATASLDRVYRTGESIEAKEYAVKSADPQEQRFLHYNVQALRDNTGAIVGLLTHSVEVTEQVRAKREREQLVEELQRTLRYNEMFAGMLGHDLRNPLGAITMGAQLALRRGPDEQIRKPLVRILSAAERMARMIDQLLDFTRIRIGNGIELRPVQSDLEQLCRRVLEELEDANPAWTIKLDVSGDATGEWDADRLLQVISNVVSNALKHGESSEPLVIAIDGKAPQSVTLTIRNQGEIPGDLLPVLFDPFRGTHQRRDRASGLGLGLFITRQIVLAHRGTVDVTSNGTGTTLTVSLPRRVRSDHTLATGMSQ